MQPPKVVGSHPSVLYMWWQHSSCSAHGFSRPSASLPQAFSGAGRCHLSGSRRAGATPQCLRRFFQTVRDEFLALLSAPDVSLSGLVDAMTRLLTERCSADQSQTRRMDADLVSRMLSRIFSHEDPVYQRARPPAPGRGKHVKECAQRLLPVMCRLHQAHGCMPSVGQ